METKKLPRRERERLRQRQEMLAAALALFSEKGYHNVSMQEIAKRAEFAIGTLYKFFQNKEDLYRALILEQSQKFHNALMQAIQEPEDEVEKLRNYIRTKGELFREHLPFIRLYLAESRGASFNIKAGLDDEVRKLYDTFLESLGQVFKSGIKKNQFKKVAEPFHLAVALDSVINSLLLLWLNAPERHSYPQNPDVILDIFLKGLIAS